MSAPKSARAPPAATSAGGAPRAVAARSIVTSTAVTCGSTGPHHYPNRNDAVPLSRHAQGARRAEGWWAWRRGCARGREGGGRGKGLCCERGRAHRRASCRGPAARCAVTTPSSTRGAGWFEARGVGAEASYRWQRVQSAYTWRIGRTAARAGTSTPMAPAARRAAGGSAASIRVPVARRSSAR
jgi:hypothetical protein